jgi:hypothetical protein
MNALHLNIAPIIKEARAVSDRVKLELPGHDGLLGATIHVADAGVWAQKLSLQMKKPWSLHRLPVVFLSLALGLLLLWGYWHFFHISSLTLALPQTDAAQIRTAAQSSARIRFGIQEMPGSFEASQLVAKGLVDLAYVQGGIELPAQLPRAAVKTREYIFFLVRAGKQVPQDIKVVLTSVENEGSHAVAQKVFSVLGAQVSYRHEWKNLTSDNATIASDIDAVLVVKDVYDEKSLGPLPKLIEAGFVFAPLDLGLRAGQFDFLEPISIEAHALTPTVPEQPVKSYSVQTYLVARQGLSEATAQQALEVLLPSSPQIERHLISASETAELLQGVDAFFSILINIALAFLALTGLDVWAYRKPFHELNSLVSLLSLLQSDKDVLGVTDPETRKQNLLYLSLVSDLLSLVSAISGYYTQENSSLLFNNQSEVVHQRCDALKLNIQLKILHATVHA